MFERLAKWYLIQKQAWKMSCAKPLQEQQTKTQQIPLTSSKQMQEVYAREDMTFIKFTTGQGDHDNPKMVSVPEFDYELLKIIRINLGKGVITDIFPPEKLMQLEGNIDTDLANKMQFKNAEQMHKFYGFSKQKVLEITGCHLK